MEDAKKSLGQHWLEDKTSLEVIVAAGQVNDDDTVLEIGPGKGSLTKLLVGRAKKVIAVEFDHDLARNLTNQVSVENLEIIEEDVRKFDFGSMPVDYKIVANIPYYLTAHLLKNLGKISNKPSLAVLLVQKEVAERVCASPGELSILAVSVQLFYEPSLGQVVLARLFQPPPKVDSQVLILKKREQPPFADLNEAKFFKLVKAGFGEKRKKLRSSLAGGLGIDKSQVDELLARAGIDGDLRAQNLSLDDWHKLYQIF